MRLSPMADERITGTAFIISDDQRQPGVAFLGDPSNSFPGAKAFAALFATDRLSPAEASFPWITQLVAQPNDDSSAFNLQGMNLSSLRFDNLTFIDPSWTIEYFGNVLSEAHFGSLVTLNGAISITGCVSLRILDFPKLTTIAQTNATGRLELTGNGIVNVNGLSALTIVAGNFNLSSSNSLNNLTGLKNLRTISGTMTVQACVALVDVSPLFGITKLSGTIDFSGCAITSTMVDNFLIAMAAKLTSSSAGGHLNLQFQSPAAPPTSASAAARTTLTSLGVNFTTD